MQPKPPSKKIILTLIFLALLVKELIFAITIPPWQNHDEPTHFAYTQYLVEKKRLPVYKGELINKDLSFSEEYAESEIITDATRMMKGSNRYFSKVHQRFNDNLFDYRVISDQLSGLSRHPQTIAQAPESYQTLYYSLPPEGNVYKNAAAIYQPLYYMLEAIPYLIFKNHDILVRLYAMRIFSMLIYLAAIALCYLIAMRLTKNLKFSITLTLLIGLQPVLSHLLAGINNDALLFFLTTLTIYWCVRLIQKLSLKDSIWLGLTLGLGMLTKPQFIVFPLLVLIPFGYHFLKNNSARIKIIKYFLVVVLITLVISGWWFIWSHSHYGNFFGPSSTLDAQTDTLSLGEMLPQYVNRWIYGFLSFSFLFGFATEMALPLPIIGFCSALILLGILGLIRLVIIKWKTADHKQKAIAFLLACSIILMELLLLYLFSKNLFLTGQGRFPTDGRYYFPVIFSFIFLWLVGLRIITPKPLLKWVYIVLIISAVIINYVTLFHVLLPNFYL